MNSTTLSSLKTLFEAPTLKNAEKLLASLRDAGYQEVVLGRRNQLATLEANSAPFFSVKERIVNAWEGTCRAAAKVLGITPKTPLEAASIFNPNLKSAKWEIPTALEGQGFDVPVLKILDEPDPAIVNAGAKKIVTVLVKDSGGMTLDVFKRGFLTLNGDEKMDDAGSWGRYGMGGSSSLSFCDYLLTVTRSRDAADTVLFTLVFVKHETNTDKQEFVRYWIADDQNNPLSVSAKDFDVPFGTHIFHIGYVGDGWAEKDAVNPNSAYSWAAEAFASLPLLFDLSSSTPKYHRIENKGVFFKLNESDKTKYVDEVPIDTKPYTYSVGGQNLGTITVGGFVESSLRGPKHAGGGSGSTLLRGDSLKRIFYTHYGLTHAVVSNSLLIEAGYAYMKERAIIEIKLDAAKRLEKVFGTNREGLKDSEHVKVIRQLVIEALRENPTLQRLEREEAAAVASKPVEITGLFDGELSGEILKGQLGNQPVIPYEEGKGAWYSAVNKSKKKTTKRPSRKGSGGHPPLPPIPVNDPPTMLEFVGKVNGINLKPGKKVRIRFETDADRTKFTFANGNIQSILFDTPNTVTIDKSVLRASGRGYIDVLYTGDPQVKRTVLGTIAMRLSQPFADGTQPVRTRELFTKSQYTTREVKGYGIHAPKVGAEYFVVDKNKYPEGFPDWGISAEQLMPMGSAGCLFNDIPSALNLQPVDYPPMAEYTPNGTNSALRVHFNLSRKDLSKVEFLKYVREVCYKATLDFVPKLNVFVESLRIADIVDNPEAKVRNALKNHLQAKRIAEEWKNGGPLPQKQKSMTAAA